ncbi:ABC transporter permease [Aeromonas veronii]|uniref:ABC transporter permease n=1 Tax=Aeromonas veronii TaxID=654 RepID=UPI00142FA73F|nr:ABC transporter permease [Aeromonas veronii]NJI24580.1 ABC transporter permease [Aeromonas veronii]NJI34750.1 ABC transporter permease [Aeromonas veronii]
MRRPDVIRFAAVALLRQRSRALVLILAVSLSVTSVLLLTALGEGARRYVADQFSSLGKDLLVMFPGRKETTGGLPPVTGNSLRQITLDDMHYLGQHQPNVRLVPLVMGFAEAKQGARLRQTMLLGSSNGLRDTHGLELLFGRWLPGDAAEDRPAVLLGAKVARELFGQVDPVGQWLRFDNRRFRVVGVFTSQSSNLGMDMAEAALIPVGSAMRLFNTEGLFRLLIQPLAGQAVPPLVKRLEQLMQARHGVLDVTVVRRDAMLATFSTILSTLTLAVAGIGAISLLVSGIMMMNLALISTRQRTGEIGLLKALGADSRQIRQLFLWEALLLSGSGALFGTVLGYALVSLAGLIWPGFPAAVPLLATFCTIPAALLTGLFFSWLPASRAARQDPVSSLRSGQWSGG